tara:strand:- start:19272 stop:20048 length:777 start_codon:yes stop_codon:yes gene_type:complete
MADSELFPSLNINDIAPAFHLSVEEYNGLLLAHGSGAEWRRAILCPCVRIETRQPNVSCQDCRGIGRLYPDSMRDPLIVLDTSRTATMKWAAAGLIAAGSITLTFPCGEIPGVGDMILTDCDIHVVNEFLFEQGTKRVTDGMLREHRTRPDHRKRALVGRSARLMYNDAQIECITYKSAEGDLVFAGKTDFTLHSDGTLEWHKGYGPQPGHAASVRYRAPAAYVIHSSAPMLRREHGENMPYRVSAMRLDKISPDDLR